MSGTSARALQGQSWQAAALRQKTTRPAWLPLHRPTRCRCASPPGARGPLRVHRAPQATPGGAGTERHDSVSTAQPGDSEFPWHVGWQWLGRAACCAVAAAVALGMLAGSASADLSASAAAAAAAPGVGRSRDLPLAQLRLRDDGSDGVGVGSGGPLHQQQQQQQQQTVFAASAGLPRAQRIAEPGGGGAAAAGAVSYTSGAEGDGALLLQRALLYALYGDGSGATSGSSSGGGAVPAPSIWLAASSPSSSPSLARTTPQPHAHLAALQGPGPSLPSPAAAPSPDLRFVLDSESGAHAASPLGLGSGPGRPAVAFASSPPAPLQSQGQARSADDGSGGGGVSGDLATETEDRLLEAARQVEARLEGVFGVLAGGVPQLMGGPEVSQDAARATQAAHALIREVWEVVDSNYLDARATGFNRERWGELKDAALAMPYRDTAAGYRAIRDMLARGLSDPYCRFIGPSELDAMKKYDVSGVGLNLGTASEYVIKTGNELPAPRDPSAGEGIFVVGVSKGSSADLVGIRQGDELLALQGESLADTTPFRASGLISGAAEETAEDGGGGGGGGQQQRRQQQGKNGGKPGDVVRVKVRHGSGQVEEVALVRPRRTLPSTVTTSISRSAVQLPGGGRGEEVVGTVRLAAFNARAQSDVSSAIRKLEAAGATQLVLDLRDNRGGLVTEGLEVARLFLDGDAPIVITERRDATPDTPRAPGPALTSAPLLVLVNGHTASASEIVAGALRDNCRAVLAGSRTYGKGLIQSVYELSDGSGLVITVGKYLTPGGNDIDRFGIKPDFSSVPSGAQYDSTVKACKLAAQLAAPPVYAEVAQVAAGGGGGAAFGAALGGVFGGR